MRPRPTRWLEGIGPQAEVDMGVPFTRIRGKELADYRLARQRRQGDRRYKLFAVGGNHDLDLGTGLDKGT